jgi:hypothetical protein
VASKRRRFLVDRDVQLGLISRLIFHWITFFATVVVGLPLFRALVLGDISTPLNQRLQHAAVDGSILLVIFVLLLPYFIYDSLKTTNRFAGPIHRLRSAMRELAAGKPFTPIRLRKGDFWHEVADEFNSAVEGLQAGRDARLTCADVEGRELAPLS